MELENYAFIASWPKYITIELNPQEDITALEVFALLKGLLFANVKTIQVDEKWVNGLDENVRRHINVTT